MTESTMQTSPLVRTCPPSGQAIDPDCPIDGEVSDCAEPAGNEVVCYDDGGPEDGPHLATTTAHALALDMTGTCPWCGEQAEGEWDDCPEHGRQPVVGSGSTGPREDPYGASRLACGHWVTCWGPGEPNVICTARPDPSRWA